MVVVLLAISEGAYWRSSKSMAQIEAIAMTQANLQTLLRHHNDAETALRGYLLTGRSETMQTCRDALVGADQMLQRLNAYYADDAGQAERMHRLVGTVRMRQSDIDSSLGLFTSGKREEAIRLTLVAPGNNEAQTIRQVTAELAAAESDKLVAARNGVRQTLMFNRIGIDVMAALSLVALYLYLRQAATTERLRLDRQREIQAERDQLEREVTRRTSQLIQLTRHLQSAREDERSHLARELHDELGALLTAAKLDAARIKSRLGTREPEVLERLAHLNASLNSGIALKRRIIEDLRPSSLSNLGLAAALAIQAREFEKLAHVQVTCQLEPVRLSPAAELTVYRLVQEAFTNIAKYARANKVEVALGARDAAARIVVCDDGVGFDPTSQKQSAHGLLGMRYRVEAEGGSLEIVSAPGAGTRISASIPEQRAA
jgi:signal transduction histidine kinase